MAKRNRSIIVRDMIKTAVRVLFLLAIFALLSSCTMLSRRLYLSVPSQIIEGDTDAVEVAGQGSLSISRVTPLTADLTVELSMSVSGTNPNGRVQIPGSAKILVDTNSVDFDISVDRNLATDGDVTVTITATTPFYGTDSATFRLVDDD